MLRRLAFIAALGTGVAACVAADDGDQGKAALRIDGDRGRGHDLVDRAGCGSCHVIPGVRSAQGRVGPPLSDIATRSYIAGSLPNTPANMVAWVQHPQRIDPATAMPDLGLSEAEARDIAAYLYTLR